ncbi:MAG: DUF721 domain-containing protein [Pseudomonadota bacterium]
MTSDKAKPQTERKRAKSDSAYERKARGFLRAGELTPAALKTAGAKRGFAELRLLTEWRAVVGEALARVCRPVKVSYSRKGPGLGATLIVTAEGARAPEVDMQKERILEKVNAFYGYRAVSRLSIDQSRANMMQARLATTGMAEAAAGWSGPAAKPAPRPVDGVEDEGLALALARLGANVTAKARKSKPDAASADPNPRRS